MNDRPTSETAQGKTLRIWLGIAGFALVLVAAGFALRIALESPTTPVILVIVATAMLATAGAARLVNELIERRRAEQEAERLKDEFFGMVSHEMRTPLTSIIGYAELLSDVEAENLSEQGRGFVEVIERNAQREMRLVGDLLILVRIEAGTFTIDLESAALADLAREALDAALPRADGAGVTLSLDIAGELPPLAGDPHRLGQVLDNLLSNAIKFTSDGGEVELHLSREGQTAVIEVRDSGIGIPADEQERLFDRLYRAESATRRHIPGVGLGLTIVKAIVEAHEGTVSVRSEQGVGTTFRVELPVRPPPVEGEQRRPAPDRLAQYEAAA